MKEAEEKRLLSQSQFAYLAAIARLLRSSERTEWEKSLELLDAIPCELQCRLQSVMVLRNIALTHLGRFAESAELLTDFLCEARQPEAWWEHGLILGELTAAGRLDDSLRAKVGRRMLEAALRDRMAPQQILASRFLVTGPGEADDDLVQMAVEALEIASWSSAGRWRKTWLPWLACAFFIAVEQLGRRDRTDDARRVGRAAVAFDWESAGRMSHAERGLLCLSFWMTELPDETRRVADLWRRADESAGVAWYWLALFEAHHQRTAKAAQLARRALRGRGLKPQHMLGLAKCLAAEGDLAGALKVLDRLGPQEDARWWGLRGHCLERSRPDEALQCFEKEAELSAGDLAPLMRSVAVHMEQNRLAEAMELLGRVASDPQSAIAPTARLLAASLRSSGEEKVRDLEYFLQEEHRWDQVFVEEGASYFASTYARALTDCGRFTEALEWARIAVESGREEHDHATLIAALVKSGQRDEAERELALACRAWPRATGLWALRVQLDLVRERWRAVLEQLEGKGFERFVAHVGLKNAVITRAVALEGIGDALGVLETCNAHAELASSEELNELRIDALQTLREQRGALQEQVRAQATLAADADASRRAAERQERRAKQLEAELSRVMDQSRKAASARMLPGEAPVVEARTGVERERAQLLARLTPSSRAHVISASRLWEKLTDHPAEDHGPVVLQLARALEGEVNRLVVDPFVGHALDQQMPLSRLQATTDGNLRPNANRLSLGEAAALLHARLEQRNPDGSTTVVRNARSDPHHAALIESFWGSRSELKDAHRDYLKNEFLLTIQGVARVRNQAGHAGAVIARERAGELMTLLLGSRPGEGALERLVELSPERATA